MINSFEKPKNPNIDSFDLDFEKKPVKHLDLRSFDFDKKIETEELINKVKNELPEKRVLKLKELGIITELEGYDWGCLDGDRFYVFANIKGVPVPIYRTSARTGGKSKNFNFFPFFGMDETGWVIKGNKEQLDTFYGIKELEDVSNILTNVFDFETDRRKDETDPNSDEFFNTKVRDIYIPEGKEILDNFKIDELLSKRFNIDFDIVNKMERQSMEVVEYTSSRIFKEINLKNNPNK